MLIDLDLAPVAQQWHPLEVEVFREEGEKERPSGDYPYLAPSLPVFSRRALDVLWPLLEGSGETLRLECREGDYVGFHVTRVVDALNRDLSEVVYFSSGRVMCVERYVLNSAKLSGNGIFRIPEIISSVFVTGDFMRIAEEARPRGLGFERVSITVGEV